MSVRFRPNARVGVVKSKRRLPVTAPGSQALIQLYPSLAPAGFAEVLTPTMIDYARPELAAEMVPLDQARIRVLLERVSGGDAEAFTALYDETSPYLYSVLLRMLRKREGRLILAEPTEQRALWEQKFLDAQRRGFVPAGRINSAAGTPLAATLINCFVQPVGDSIAVAELASSWVAPLIARTCDISLRIDRKRSFWLLFI